MPQSLLFTLPAVIFERRRAGTVLLGLVAQTLLSVLLSCRVPHTPVLRVGLGFAFVGATFRGGPLLVFPGGLPFAVFAKGGSFRLLLGAPHAEFACGSWVSLADVLLGHSGPQN